MGDDSYPIHSPSQRADLRLLADCVRSDAHSHIVHTQLMLDMVDQSPSRVDKVPDVARIRTPVTSDLSVCDWSTECCITPRAQSTKQKDEDRIADAFSSYSVG